MPYKIKQENSFFSWINIMDLFCKQIHPSCSCSLIGLNTAFRESNWPYINFRGYKRNKSNTFLFRFVNFSLFEFLWLDFGWCSVTVSWCEVYLVHRCPGYDLMCNLKSRHGALSFTDPSSLSVLHTTSSSCSESAGSGLDLKVTLRLCKPLYFRVTCSFAMAMKTWPFGQTA